MRSMGYQAAARDCGTRFVPASPGFAPLLGGAITKHPVALAVAGRLANAIRELGGEARIVGDNGDQSFVYLSGCSFDRGERL